MHRADVGDDADVGLGDLAQLGDLADAAHRHLEHQDLGAGRRRQDRQRQADLGVVVLRARVDPERQERLRDVLDRRLAGRAGDPHHLGVELPAPLARERLKRRERVALREDPPEPVARARPHARAEAGRRRPTRPSARAPAANSPPSAFSPGSPKKRSPGATSRESITARSGRPVRALARGSRGRPRRRSARAKGRSITPAPPGAQPVASSSRATSRSSNGIFRPPSNSWPCSWPLPAITTVSPAPASSSAPRIAARRSTSTTHVVAPPSIPAGSRRRSPRGPRSAGCPR